MVQRGENLGFTLQAGETFGIGGERVGEHFDRDSTLQVRVDGAIDLTHPPGANLRGDLVGTEPGARSQRHVGTFYPRTRVAYAPIHQSILMLTSRHQRLNIRACGPH